MLFSFRRDSDTRPSQKSSHSARCLFRSITTAVLRPFSSVKNWIPVIAIPIPNNKHTILLALRRHRSPAAGRETRFRRPDPVGKHARFLRPGCFVGADPERAKRVEGPLACPPKL